MSVQNLMDRESTRREVVRRLAVMGCGVAGASAFGGRVSASQQATPIARPGSAQPLVHRGVNYDIGTGGDGYISRSGSDRLYLKQEIQAIKDDLHCTSVGIFGGNFDTLLAAAEVALETGLHVRLQSRFNESAIDETVQLTVELAREAEKLAVEAETELILDLGCEMTLFTDGIIPGSSFDERVATLLNTLDHLPEYNRTLNEMFVQIIDGVRPVFSGRLTYGSGPWESVDWAPFDIVGVDHYRDADNAATYVSDLRSYGRHNKPVIVTEFGCCCYAGAENRGGSGYDIIDWTATPPSFKGDYVRSEATQAQVLMDLLDIFEAEQVYGAFAYQFIAPDIPHNLDPKQDLDMASFSLVKTYADGSDHDYQSTGYWEPKESFHALAARYAP